MSDIYIDITANAERQCGAEQHENAPRKQAAPRHRYSTRSKVNMKQTKVEELLLKDEIDEAFDHWNEKDTYKWLILDVEAYTLNTAHRPDAAGSNGGSVDTIPVQIAWNVCEYGIGKGAESKCKFTKMYYVAESLTLSKYRNMLNFNSRYFTQNTLRKHEKHLIQTNFVIQSAAEILRELKEDLKECDIFSAFNMEWDINALKNLCKMASVSTPEERIRLYPLTPAADRIVPLEQIDIMVMGYLLFKKELTGGSGGSGDDGDREKRKDGKYTVSNMHKVLCKKNETQAHLAEMDVVMEQEILLEILKHFKTPKEFHSFINHHNLTIPKWSKKKIIE
jgi:hypothetical protein